ncbi:MAG: 16S rRNA (guanine(966)-N(2))-methyltransferase RsmD [Blastocatellia bacterium]
MRIIAGLYKGRRLKTLPGMSVRPTTDRLRVTIFNILAAEIEGARVADLCAGSGAVAIEALSRGAAEAVLVEQSARATAVIRENLRQCAIREEALVLQRPVLPALRSLATLDRRFDLIYFDPPYESPLYEPVINAIDQHELLTPDGTLLVEHHRSHPLLPTTPSLRPFREIVQGEVRVTLYRRDRVIGFGIDEKDPDSPLQIRRHPPAENLSMEEERWQEEKE